MVHTFTAPFKEFLISGLARDMFDEFDLGFSGICDGNLELMIGGPAAKGLFGGATTEILDHVETWHTPICSLKNF
jgi:hypothetical protein